MTAWSATPQTLRAALAASTAAGDRVLLGPGAYKLKAAGLHLPGVTVVGGPGARFEGYSEFADSEGLGFEGVSFIDTAGTTALGLKRCGRFAFDDCLFEGRTGAGCGLSVQDGQNIAVRRSRFSGLAGAITHARTMGLRVEESEFRDLASDGVIGCDTARLTIRANRFTGFRPRAGVHPDAIQLWTTTERPNRNVLIEENEIVRGAGQAVQGIFLQKGTGGYVDLTVRRNLILGMTFHGITVGGASEAKVTGNVALAFKETAGFASRVLLLGCPDVAVVGNLANDVAFSGTAPSGPNTELPTIAPTDPLPLAVWRAAMAA